MKIGLFYSSDTGNTETVAETMRDEIGEHIVDVHEVCNIDLPELHTIRFHYFRRSYMV